jgi:type I restriction enzyme M protein
MSNESSAIVQRIWNYCHVLRDDGVSYGDYLEQLTYLLFLKMDAERALLGQATRIPEQYSWPQLVKRDGAELEKHYLWT